jgi:hypothetical protein
MISITNNRTSTFKHKLILLLILLRNIKEAFQVSMQFRYLLFLPSNVSNRFLGCDLEVISLKDGAVRSGQSTEKTIKKPWEHLTRN